jgi:ABC-type multidrug transport system fused ATPase/permease subunit
MTTLLADSGIGTGEFLLWMVEIFLFVIFFWMLFVVITDVFRRHDIHGGMKTFWIILVILLPFLGIFVYVISQGHGMAERAQEAQQAQVQAMRQTIGYSSADELEKLKKLHDAGTINDADYEKMKAKVVG